MSNIRKWMGRFFLFILLLMVLGALSNRFPFSHTGRVRSLELVTEKAPDDHLFDELIRLGDSINSDLPDKPLNADTLLVLKNGRILAELFALFHNTYSGNFLIERTSTRTKIVTDISGRAPMTVPVFHLLDLLEAKLRIQVSTMEQNQEDNTIQDTLDLYHQICLAIIQNPSMFDLMTGSTRLMKLYSFVQENKLQPSTAFRDGMPDFKDLSGKLCQAYYLEMVLMEEFILSKDLQGSLDSGFKSWGLQYLLNRETTIRYLNEDMERFLKGVNQRDPLLFEPISHFNQWNPAHLVINPIGRILYDVGKPKTELYFVHILQLSWQIDALKLSLARQAGPAGSQPDPNETDKLVNPVSGEHYQLNDKGQLILTPPPTKNPEQYRPKWEKSFPVEFKL